MAPSRRLERLTHSLEGCCSIQLSYEGIYIAFNILNKCENVFNCFHHRYEVIDKEIKRHQQAKIVLTLRHWRFLMF